MSLDLKTVQEIQDFVYIQPRTIQEVAQYIKKNWRTADSYIEQIKAEKGILATKTFRPGTRGALKIVFWANTEKIHANGIQEILFNQIKTGRYKEDFEPFDIYYFSDPEKREVYVKKVNVDKDPILVDLIKSTNKTLYIFSGNLSWINKKFDKEISSVLLKNLVKKGVTIKIITRVDIASMKNLNEIEKINKEIGNESIEIRHMYQPLRGFIFDSSIVNLKEEKPLSRYKKDEIKYDMDIFYNIRDPKWVGWIEKIFWNFFSNSIPANERIKELKKIDEKILNMKD